MATLKIWTLDSNNNGYWAIVEDLSGVKYIEQELTEAQKAQARTNIGAAAPSEITSQVTALSNQLYDENYGTESGTSIRYIAGQVVNDKAVSLSKGTRKDDLDFTYTNGAWNISPVGNYYGSVTTPITAGTYALAKWIIKGIELADGGCQQTLISGGIKLSRRTNTDNTWTAWKDEAVDNKLDKSVATGLYRAYGINDKGEQTMWTVQSSINTTGATGYIARYMSKSSFGDTKPTYDNGTLITGDPNKPYHVANKNYVDNTFVNKAGDTITGDLTITGNLQIKDGVPIVTKEEFDDSWEKDAIFVFDKDTKSFKYSGKTLESYKKEIQDEMKEYVANYIETYMSTVRYENLDGETVSIDIDEEYIETEENDAGGITYNIGG